MPDILIFGPINSGTNLVKNIFDNNCKNILTDTIVNRTLFAKDWIPGVDMKHTIDTNILNNFCKNDNSLIIIMYKNIYNWIYSIKKESYHIDFKSLNKPVKCDNKTYHSVISLYNHTYNLYIDLLKKYPNVIFLDYYKVSNKNTSFDYINNKLFKYNLRLSSNEKFLSCLNKPAKEHGNSVKNSNEVLNTYIPNQKLVKKYLIEYTKIYKFVNHNIIDFFEKE
jgi:hypothetical protein